MCWNYWCWVFRTYLNLLIFTPQYCLVFLVAPHRAQIRQTTHHRHPHRLCCLLGCLRYLAPRVWQSIRGHLHAPRGWPTRSLLLVVEEQDPLWYAKNSKELLILSQQLQFSRLSLQESRNSQLLLLLPTFLCSSRSFGLSFGSGRYLPLRT